MGVMRFNSRPEPVGQRCSVRSVPSASTALSALGDLNVIATACLPLPAFGCLAALLEQHPFATLDLRAL